MADTHVLRQNLSINIVKTGDIISIGQLVVAAIGFYVFYRQLKSINASLQSEAQSKLYSQSSDVRKLLAQYPELRKYFFDRKEIGKDHDNYERARTLAELYANYLEHFLIQEPNLGKEEMSAWRNTLKDIYISSPIIRDLIAEKQDWYCKKLRQFAQRIDEEDSEKSKP